MYLHSIDDGKDHAGKNKQDVRLTTDLNKCTIYIRSHNHTVHVQCMPIPDVLLHDARNMSLS